MPRAERSSPLNSIISIGSGRTIERNNLPVKDPFDCSRWFFASDVRVAGRRPQRFAYHRRDRESHCVYSPPRSLSWLFHGDGGGGEVVAGEDSTQAQDASLCILAKRGGVAFVALRRRLVVGIVDRNREKRWDPPLGAQWHALIGLITVISA